MLFAPSAIPGRCLGGVICPGLAGGEYRSKGGPPAGVTFTAVNRERGMKALADLLDAGLKGTIDRALGQATRRPGSRRCAAETGDVVFD